MSNAAKKETLGTSALGTVKTVETGAEYRPIEFVAFDEQATPTARKARGARTLAPAEEERYNFVARNIPPIMLQAIRDTPQGNERSIMRGDSAILANLVPSVIRYLRNHKVGHRVVEFVPGSATADGRGIIKVRNPRQRAAKRTVVELSEAERALFRV